MQRMNGWHPYIMTDVVRSPTAAHMIWPYMLLIISWCLNIGFGHPEQLPLGFSLACLWHLAEVRNSLIKQEKIVTVGSVEREDDVLNSCNTYIIISNEPICNYPHSRQWLLCHMLTSDTDSEDMWLE